MIRSACLKLDSCPTDFCPCVALLVILFLCGRHGTRALLKVAGLPKATPSATREANQSKIGASEPAKSANHPPISRDTQVGRPYGSHRWTARSDSQQGQQAAIMQSGHLRLVRLLCVGTTRKRLTNAKLGSVSQICAGVGLGLSTKTVGQHTAASPCPASWPEFSDPCAWPSWSWTTGRRAFQRPVRMSQSATKGPQTVNVP